MAALQCPVLCNCVYQRDNARLTNLLGIVRLCLNDETPQYLPSSPDDLEEPIVHLSGFIEKKCPELWHYFSIGCKPTTQDEANKQGAEGKGLYKLEIHEKAAGANTAFRYQQIIEMVQFFVHPTLQQSDKQVMSLCRVAHYLRSSPYWSTGNTLLPFPMHLAKTLIEDYLCLLT
jgi:hypothetical protein